MLHYIHTVHTHTHWVATSHIGFTLFYIHALFAVYFFTITVLVRFTHGLPSRAFSFARTHTRDLFTHLTRSLPGHLFGLVTWFTFSYRLRGYTPLWTCAHTPFLPHGFPFCLVTVACGCILHTIHYTFVISLPIFWFSSHVRLHTRVYAVYASCPGSEFLAWTFMPGLHGLFTLDEHHGSRTQR